MRGWVGLRVLFLLLDILYCDPHTRKRPFDFSTMCRCNVTPLPVKLMGRCLSKDTDFRLSYQYHCKSISV